MDFFETINTRKTIRKYKSDMPNMEDIKKISSQTSKIVTENMELKSEEEGQKSTAWGKMKSFVRKAVDCCIE